jgi:hypothetical protein
MLAKGGTTYEQHLESLGEGAKGTAEAGVLREWVRAERSGRRNSHSVGDKGEFIRRILAVF